MRMKSAVNAPENQRDDEDQVRRELKRLAAVALLELLSEHGHERSLDRGVGEQAANEVRDLERDA